METIIILLLTLLMGVFHAISLVYKKGEKLFYVTKGLTAFVLLAILYFIYNYAKNN